MQYLVLYYWDGRWQVEWWGTNRRVGLKQYRACRDTYGSLNTRYFKVSVIGKNGKESD